MIDSSAVSISLPQFDDFTKMRLSARILRSNDKKVRQTDKKMRSSDRRRFGYPRKYVVFIMCLGLNTIML